MSQAAARLLAFSSNFTDTSARTYSTYFVGRMYTPTDICIYACVIGTIFSVSPSYRYTTHTQGSGDCLRYVVVTHAQIQIHLISVGVCILPTNYIVEYALADVSVKPLETFVQVILLVQTAVVTL